MKIVLQRVSRAAVRVDGNEIASIGGGLLLLVGFGAFDTELILRPMAEKLLGLRIFSNDAGRFDRSIVEVGGELLLVPQFTLYGETTKGRRPDFSGAMPPDAARTMFTVFAGTFRELGFERVKEGRFGAHMLVSLENDGPVTLILESGGIELVAKSRR